MEERRNRDFSKGRVRSPSNNRWLVKIRYPDGSHLRKRLRREREVLRLLTGENANIESGTWDDRVAKNVTVATAFEQYREYAKVQHRAYKTYHAPARANWEQHLGPQTLLAKVTPAQVEEFKLKQEREVARATVDKELTVLKALFNWSIARGLAVSNPVRRVKLFHDETRGFGISRARSDRRIEAAKQIKASPYLVEKIVLAAHMGLRRGSLFNLRWEQIDFANRVMGIPRTKSGHVPRRAIGLDRKCLLLLGNLALRTGRFPQLAHRLSVRRLRAAAAP